MQPPYQPVLDLLHTPLFSNRDYLSPFESARRSYQRAKAIGLAYQLTFDDIKYLTDKYWALHRDHIIHSDAAAATILTIHYNLAVGTIAQYLPERTDLQPLIDDLLSWKINAQLCLSELDHGLDIAHMETVAELLPDGRFVLKTPTHGAAKYMSPTIPVGIPCVAIVCAKLKVNSQDHGMRTFIVPINDGNRMYPGITAKLLPYRNGSKPVNHSLTFFHNVILDSSALLGSLDPLPPSASMLTLWRLAVGYMSLAVTVGSGLRAYAAIGYRYSLRRTVVDATTGRPVPILSFRTQQIPICVALANAHVLNAFDAWAIDSFRDESLDPRVRRGIAACFKAISVKLSQESCLAISDRCGAQGLFEYNQMSGMFADVRGVAIAEGDILAISIRLAVELLLKRYALPAPRYPTSPLARREAALFDSARQTLDTLSSHRSPAFNTKILPLCLPLVEAVGHRMAYEAACATPSIPQCATDLFLAALLKLDAAWYAESGGISRTAQMMMEESAVSAVLERAEELVNDLNADAYLTAPIVSEARFDQFIKGLVAFGSETGSQDWQDEQKQGHHLRHQHRSDDVEHAAQVAVGAIAQSPVSSLSMVRSGLKSRL